MTVDPYVGSAGGQPRLTLPFSNLQRPPTAAEWNRTMRTLYTWANSLLLPTPGGSSSITGWAYYVGGPSGSPIDNWDLFESISGGSFTYLQSDDTSFEFPAQTISLVIAKIKGGQGAFTVTDPGNIQLYINDGGAVGEVDGSYFTAEPSTSSGMIEDGVIASIMVDGDATTPSQPYTVTAEFANFSAITNFHARLQIYTWGKP